MKSYPQFSDLPTQSIWVGLRLLNGAWTWSNGEKLNPATAFWAPGEPIAGKECAVADKSLGYKWRTMNCANKNPYFCSLWIPKCPSGECQESRL